MLARFLCLLAAALLASAGLTGFSADPLSADLLLKGGTIYDGGGGPARTGDVAIRDGKIVAVGPFTAGQIGRTIDCAGLVVAPGFIDLHTHCEPVGRPELRRNLNYLRQGCTTVVTGNCGGGALDVSGYLAGIDRDGAGTNVILLLGHGSIRQKVTGGDNRAPTAEELEQMRQRVDRGMREGAWGMSTGLIYAPGMFAKTDEIVELAKVVARHQGLYVSHIRNEAARLLPSIEEAVSVGRSAKIPVHISHFKAVGPKSWGSVRQAAAAVEKARVEGLTVTADQYPYIATSTGLVSVLFPATELPGGLKDFSRRMQSDSQYQTAVRDLVRRRLGDNPRIMIASCKKHPEWTGKSLDQIAAELKTNLVEAAIRIQTDGGAAVVRFVLSEDDVRYLMTIPWVATGSDGSTAVPSPDVRPHPRSFGTFPRKIGRYAAREKVLSVAQAIRSATGLPADILHLTDRGYLRPGMVADVVVFDPEQFIDRATFDDPQQYSPGVRWLLVGGKAAIDDGKPAEQLFGRALRHASVTSGTP